MGYRYRIIESRHVDDQWYIARRRWGFWWQSLSVRTGLERAAERVREYQEAEAEERRMIETFGPGNVTGDTV